MNTVYGVLYDQIGAASRERTHWSTPAAEIRSVQAPEIMKAEPLPV